MSTRNLLFILFVCLTLISCSTGGNSNSPTHEFEMVTSWPRNLETFHLASEKFAELVNTESKGRISVTIHAAGEKVKERAVFDAVALGQFALGHSLAYYYTNEDASNSFFTAVPFGLDATQHKTWLEAEGQALWDELNAQNNLIAFVAGEAGPQMGGWFKEPLGTTEDFLGLKIRSIDLAAEILSSAGVQVLLLEPNLIKVSLELGDIDAAISGGPHEDEQLQLHKAATNYYKPGWQQPATPLALYINLDTYQNLPQDLQQAIKRAADKTTEWSLDFVEEKNSEALARLVSEGTQVLDYPEPILDLLEKETQDFIEENRQGQASESYEEIYLSWKKFKN